MAEKNSDEMRYGISALSMEYREEATNDEILLDPQTGKPYYKREEDGQIVSFDDLSYSQNELPLAMNTAIMNQSLSVTTTSTDFVVYNTIDVAGKIDLFNNEDNVIKKRIIRIEILTLHSIKHKMSLS